MTYGIDIACILFASVAAIHLGLVPAIESIVGTKLPVIGCPRCLSVWATMVYGLSHTATEGIIGCIAMSFLVAWLAIWLELGMAFIDKIYLKLYGKVITTTETDATAADPDNGGFAGTVPEL